MAHQRLRPFNTRDTYPEQNLDNDLSQVVVARGTMVFLRGQVSQDLETRESLHVGDAGKQAEKAMANIAMLLEEAGSALDQVVGSSSTSPISATGRPCTARWEGGLWVSIPAKPGSSFPPWPAPSGWSRLRPPRSSPTDRSAVRCPDALLPD